MTLPSSSSRFKIEGGSDLSKEQATAAAAFSNICTSLERDDFFRLEHFSENQCDFYELIASGEGSSCSEIDTMRGLYRAVCFPSD